MIVTDQKARARADLICQYLAQPTEDITNQCLADVMGQEVVDELSDGILEALEGVEWKGNLYASMRLKEGLFYNIEPVQEGVEYDALLDDNYFWAKRQLEQMLKSLL